MLLILFGVAIRRLGLLTDQGVEEIKALIVRVALPAVLFVAFLSLEFDSRYRGLFVLVPVLLVLLLAAGYGLSRLFSPSGPIPLLMNGFEFGMLGIGLFTTAYGMDRVGVIAVLRCPTRSLSGSSSSHCCVCGMGAATPSPRRRAPF